MKAPWPPPTSPIRSLRFRGGLTLMRWSPLVCCAANLILPSPLGEEGRNPIGGRLPHAAPERKQETSGRWRLANLYANPKQRIVIPPPGAPMTPKFPFAALLIFLL